MKTNGFLLPAILVLAECVTAGDHPISQREIATAALEARAGEATVPLDLEIFRTTVRGEAEAKRTVDLALALDPRNGLTFRTIVSIGDRPFPGVQSVVESKNDVRLVEHDDRMFVFSVVANGIHIKLYLSSIKLALKHSNENNVFGAFQQTWADFEGPAHIKTWDNSPIYYYRNGFAGSLACGSSQDEAGILMTADVPGSSQCTGLAAILKGALAVNGINSELVQVGRPGEFFLVKKWTFGLPSIDTSTAPPSQADFRYRMDFSNAGIDMVPPPDLTAPTNFGDLTNDLTGLNGQNTFPPAEKIFGNHVFVLPHLIDGSSGLPVPVPGGPYFGPSYGVTYSGLAGFVSAAVDGIVSGTIPVPGYPNSKPARKVRSGDAAGFEFCLYSSTTTCIAPTP